ncbi:MAG: hypothetical protein U0263_06335 [Polyangiaceae bacterium]
MTRPEIAEFVPGTFDRPNTRKTELCLRWCRGRDGVFYLREHLDYDDSPFDERSCGYLPLGELPELPAVSNPEELRRALAARFDVHPLANQLPSTVGVISRALLHVPPLDVVRISARYLCVAGVARGFGKALAGLSGGAFRGEGEPVELRRLARACLVMMLGVLDCHGSYGPWEHWASELRDELPRYPEGKHAGHDGGQHDEVCLKYDELLSDYLAEVAELVPDVLELAPEKLDARSRHIALPKDVWSPEEALAHVHTALQKDLWLWQGELITALRELHGQPLRAIAPTLSALFSGESPVPLPEGSRVDAEGLAEGTVVKGLLATVIASDLDLADEIRAAAEKQAREEAERAELHRRRLEERRDEPPRPFLPRLPPLTVAQWLALAALVVAVVVMCSRAPSHRVSACGETAESMRARAERVLASVDVARGPPTLGPAGVRSYAGAERGEQQLPRFELRLDDFDRNPCAWALRVSAHLADRGDGAGQLVALLDEPEVRRAFERRGYFEAREDGSVWLVTLESLRTASVDSSRWLDDHLELSSIWANDWLLRVEEHSKHDAGLPPTMQFRKGHEPERVLERTREFLREAGVSD